MGVDTIEQAHQSLAPLVGSLSSGAFGIALLASGLSSSAVGTLAGQTTLVNKPLTKVVGWIIASIIIGLNAVLLYLTFTGNV